MPSRPRSRASAHAADDVPVDVFLDGFPPPMRAIAEELREVVRAATPEAIERVRVGWRLLAYDLPVKRHGVFFAWVGPEAKHVHLGFPWGVRMTDADRGLRGLRGAGITKRARWLTFVPGDPIDRQLLEGLVLEAAALAGLPRTL